MSGCPKDSFGELVEAVPLIRNAKHQHPASNIQHQVSSIQETGIKQLFPKPI
jgi:3-deoxy-D-manno-octulosonic-acid transferase